MQELKMVKYKARQYSGLTDEKATEIGTELEKLCVKKNGYTPQDVVEVAKSTNNPLHKYFEWDDFVAGNKWRLQQARQLSENVVKVIVTVNGQDEQRAFINVTNEEGKKIYVTLNEAIINKDYRSQQIDKLISVLKNGTRLLELFRDHEGGIEDV